MGKTVRQVLQEIPYRISVNQARSELKEIVLEAIINEEEVDKCYEQIEKLFEDSK